MNFNRPDYLIALIAVPVLFIIFYINYTLKTRFQKQNQTERVTTFSPKDKRFFRSLFFGLALVFLLVAAASPRFGVSLEQGERKGRDIFVLIDVSKSMNTEDLKPSRLAVTKQSVYDLLSQLKQDKIGVIVFAGDAFVLCPLTNDYEAVTMFVDSIDTEMTSAYGTDLGDAIKLASRSFPEGSDGFKTLIIFTDGEDFGNSVDNAISVAKDEGVLIFTVGVGSTTGGPVPILDENNKVVSHKKDQNGETVVSRMNPAILKKLAEDAGGIFFHAENNLVIRDLAEKINSLSKKKMESRGFVKLKDRFYYPLSAGLICLIFFLLLL